MGEPDGLTSVGSHRVGHDWSDLAAAAAWNSTSLPSGLFWNYEMYYNMCNRDLFFIFQIMPYLDKVHLQRHIETQSLWSFFNIRLNYLQILIIREAKENCSLDHQETIEPHKMYYIFTAFHHLDLNVLKRGFELLKILSEMDDLNVHFTVIFYLLI